MVLDLFKKVLEIFILVFISPIILSFNIVLDAFKTFKGNSLDTLDRLIHDIINLFNPSYYCGKLMRTIISSLTYILRMVLIVCAFSLTSFIVTVITYYMMALPKVIEKEISLSFYKNNSTLGLNSTNNYISVDNSNSQSQYSAVYFNCSTHTIMKDNCLKLEENNYKVYFEYEIVKNAFSFNSGNFEVEMSYIFNSQHYNVKKLSFLEKAEYFIELFRDIVYIPLKLLGYKLNSFLSIEILTELDNRELGLEFLEIKLKNSEINIKNPKIVFMPIVGSIRSLIWSSRLFTVPMIFMSFLFLQLSIFLFIKISLFFFSMIF